MGSGGTRSSCCARTHATKWPASQPACRPASLPPARSSLSHSFINSRGVHYSSGGKAALAPPPPPAQAQLPSRPGGLPHARLPGRPQLLRLLAVSFSAAGGLGAALARALGHVLHSLAASCLGLRALHRLVSLGLLGALLDLAAGVRGQRGGREGSRGKGRRRAGRRSAGGAGQQGAQGGAM